MSEYDVRCLNCFHRTHEGKECPYCPLPTKENPNARCRDFARADIFAARSLARIEQGLGQSHGQLMMALATIFDLIAEAYPEASDRLSAKLEARRKAAEEEIELQRTKALAEADEALKAAREAEERKALEELVEGYQKQDAPNNIIQFPVRPKPVEEDPEDPTPGVANG